MPIYNLRCYECGATAKRRSDKILSEMGVDEEDAFMRCRGCGKQMKRVPKAPTSTTKESLDNGAMTHRLERFSEAERLYRERAASDPDKK